MTSPHQPAAPRVPDDGTISMPAAYTFVDKATRGAQAHQRPRVVFIEVTNNCNLLCETCPRTFVTYEEPKTLAWDDFLRIVEQFPDMQRAVLHGIGEPLINQELPRMIEHLKARGVTVLFNTNATLLNEAWARKLIASGLDELRCSLDGADPQTYAAIRGAPLLHKIVRNLRDFTTLQRELGAATPRVSVWMTGMRENIRELPDLVRLCARMGVTEVYMQRMVYPLDAAAAGPPRRDAGDVWAGPRAVRRLRRAGRRVHCHGRERGARAGREPARLGRHRPAPQPGGRAQARPAPVGGLPAAVVHRLCHGQWQLPAVLHQPVRHFGLRQPEDGEPVRARL
jgi:wyosine [tRNA(Phe)-imidazoG37] synthetase (radical SAM superfamily)